MGLKELLMHFGLQEAEAETLIEENLPQAQANVAYNQNVRDLARMQNVEDFMDEE